jgi:hypothetical protein
MKVTIHSVSYNNTLFYIHRMSFFCSSENILRSFFKIQKLNFDITNLTISIKTQFLNCDVKIKFLNFQKRTQYIFTRKILQVL